MITQPSRVSRRRKVSHPPTAIGPDGGFLGGDGLLTIKAASEMLGVSTDYLRASSCPKYFLPSTGRGWKRIVRYVKSETLAWALANRA